MFLIFLRSLSRQFDILIIAWQLFFEATQALNKKKVVIQNSSLTHFFFYKYAKK
jgi:hypothetical protein